MKFLFIAFQKLIPQHALSRMLGRLASSERHFIAQRLIKSFMRAYKISLAEAQRQQPTDYRSFNDFFTRALQPDARPIQRSPGALTSPADGYVSQFGRIRNGTLLQAKGMSYSVNSLLGNPQGDDELPQALIDGSFITIYLAPSNYHRVHAPTDGRLTKTLAVPGKLFSVNDTTANAIPELFSRNERLVCHYDSQQGPASLVFVGAMIVASIETVWEETASPYQQLTSRTLTHDFKQGDELGRFLLGSTVILCLPPGIEFAAELAPGKPVKMGQRLGAWHSGDAQANST